MQPGACLLVLLRALFCCFSISHSFLPLSPSLSTPAYFIYPHTTTYWLSLVVVYAARLSVPPSSIRLTSREGSLQSRSIHTLLPSSFGHNL
ncbi:hypothetical protein BC939DRAFT_207343 [Gamsiella multidivaricata]|uniref:uncharacterized protein n=1 Tax=Gamsiella multidivaricata TaxID=101098 RepID=UPI00222031C0|nr:uncharacterized protein BC939DRAFT_207343 [Gamsiella multidivaricata]KAI7821342.1 hypothetical protein BC939DRAFT_207343 [Gamsiella multidivaricata]